MSKNRLKVLIIEDEAILVQALTNVFSNKFDVLVATDGEQGMEKIKNDIPDIVLLDVFLPKLNGLDILKSIKQDERTKHIPVIILSNCGGERDIQEGLDLGAAEYLVKADIELTDLVEKVTEITGV